MRDSDGAAVLEIYAQGLGTGLATFETEIPTWSAWTTGHHRHGRLVYEEKSRVIGWVALAPVSPRGCYRGVAEISIYVDAEAAGRGVGGILMAGAIEGSEAAGLWTLTASLFPENVASVRLHERSGFRRVGVRERIARLDGRWRDTVIYERRSARVGV